MDEGRVVRLGARASVVVGAVLVVAAYAGLTAVYHLDDEADGQYAAYARVSGALDGIDRRPSAQVASATGRAVQHLADSGIPASDAEALSARFSTWIANPRDEVALGALREQTAAIGEDVSRRQAGADLYTLGLTALLLGALGAAGLVMARRMSVRHRRMERALQRHRDLDTGARRMSALVDSSTDLVTVLDHDSTLLFVSPSSSAVLGILPEHLVGRRLVDLLSSHDAATIARHLVTQRSGHHDLTLRRCRCEA